MLIRELRERNENYREDARHAENVNGFECAGFLHEWSNKSTDSSRKSTNGNRQRYV